MYLGLKNSVLGVFPVVNLRMKRLCFWPKARRGKLLTQSKRGIEKVNSILGFMVPQVKRARASGSLFLMKDIIRGTDLTCTETHATHTLCETLIFLMIICDEKGKMGK